MIYGKNKKSAVQPAALSVERTDFTAKEARVHGCKPATPTTRRRREHGDVHSKRISRAALKVKQSSRVKTQIENACETRKAHRTLYINNRARSLVRARVVARRERSGAQRSHGEHTQRER